MGYPLMIGVVLLMTTVHHVTGHGRLIEPPSRSTMWRYGFNNPPNYNDNQLFCGGYSLQWFTNNGKCGVCGDNINGPLDNEPGGKYANGIIVRKYKMAAIMNVTVQLTANHKGWFEFRLCQNDDPKKKVGQDCFDRNLLANDKGITRFAISKNTPEKSYFMLQLPPGLRCRDCVLQWKYNTGNSWGQFPNEEGCVGCGPQEQFYGCADVAIGHEEVNMGDHSGPTNKPESDDDQVRPWDEQGTNQCCPCRLSGTSRTEVTYGVLLGILGFYLVR